MGSMVANSTEVFFNHSWTGRKSLSYVICENPDPNYYVEYDEDCDFDKFPPNYY